MNAAHESFVHPGRQKVPRQLVPFTRTNSEAA